MDVAAGASSAARATTTKPKRFSRCCKPAFPPSAQRAGGEPAVSSAVTCVRDHLKTDLPFPKTRPGHFQDESPGGAWLRRTWQEVRCLPQGLDLRVVPASWQEAVFRLALSAVEEEADQGRTSCASSGELGAPFRGAPSSENTIPPLSLSTKVNALSARCDFQTAQKEHRVSAHRLLLAPALVE